MLSPRFLRNVHKVPIDIGPCWVWLGRKSESGYGLHDREAAHRHSYSASRGLIPEGMTLDHLCCNRLCVNPEHLEPVTGAENTRRAAVRSRSRRGVRHGTLTEATFIRLPLGTKAALAAVALTQGITVGELARTALLEGLEFDQPETAAILKASGVRVVKQEPK